MLPEIAVYHVARPRAQASKRKCEGGAIINEIARMATLTSVVRGVNRSGLDGFARASTRGNRSASLTYASRRGVWRRIISACVMHVR